MPNIDFIFSNCNRLPVPVALLQEGFKMPREERGTAFREQKGYKKCYLLNKEECVSNSHMCKLCKTGHCRAFGGRCPKETATNSEMKNEEIRNEEIEDIREQTKYETTNTTCALVPGKNSIFAVALNGKKTLVPGEYMDTKCAPSVCSYYIMEWLPNTMEKDGPVLSFRFVKNPAYDAATCNSISAKMGTYGQLKSKQFDRILLQFPNNTMHGLKFNGGMDYPDMLDSNGNMIRGKKKQIINNLIDIMNKDTIRIKFPEAFMARAQLNDALDKCVFYIFLAELSKQDRESMLKAIGGDACMKNPTGVECTYSLVSIPDKHSYATAFVSRVVRI